MLFKKSGSCGMLSWTLTRDGILTISGAGPMREQCYPWDKYKEHIHTINIQKGVTSICKGAFRDCRGLTTVTFSGRVTSIGEDAFWFCSNLSTITLSDHVVCIGANAFKGCRSMSTITLPNSIADIGSAAFADCTGLTTIIIPDSVTSIRERTFDGCTGLRDITIPASVTSIGERAFLKCNSLINVRYSGTKKQWEAIEFNRHNDLLLEKKVLCVDGEADQKAVREARAAAERAATEKAALERAAAQKRNEERKAAIAAADEARRAAKKSKPQTTTKPTTPEASAKISQQNNKKSGTCGQNLKWELKNGVLTISGTGVIRDCCGWLMKGKTSWESLSHSIQAVIIKDGITRIGENAFSCFNDLTSVTLPDSLCSIGFNAFYHCSKLSEIVLPDQLTEIEERAFYKCVNLKKITIPMGITSIPPNTFDGCLLLKDIYYRGTTEQWLKIPGSRLLAEQIPKAKLHCSGHTAGRELTLRRAESYRKETASDIISEYCLTHAYPHVYTSDMILEDGSFIMKNTTLLGYIGKEKKVYIPEGTAAIASYAFDNCKNIEQITLPARLMSIEDKAFCGCEQLKEIYYNGSVEQWLRISGSDWVAECMPEVMLHCSVHGDEQKLTLSQAESASEWPRRHWCPEQTDHEIVLWSDGMGGGVTLIGLQYFKTQNRKYPPDNYKDDSPGVEIIYISFKEWKGIYYYEFCLGSCGGNHADLGGGGYQLPYAWFEKDWDYFLDRFCRRFTEFYTRDAMKSMDKLRLFFIQTGGLKGEKGSVTNI